MRKNNFKNISIILTILILITTFFLIIYTLNYLDYLRRELIGEVVTKMNCQENDSIQIKQILRDYYNENNINDRTIENIYSNDESRIKSVSTWFDFNNRKYKITYVLNGKTNKYEFTNDHVDKLYDYVQENKIENTINYKHICIILWTIFCILIITKVVLKFYEKTE